MTGNKLIIRILQSMNTIIVLLLALFAAALSEKFHAGWDWTQNKRNSLSPRSQQIIEKLDQPLEIIVAYTQRAEESGIKPRLEKIINFYTRIKPDLQVNYLNTTLNPQIARDMGVSQEVEVRLNYGGRSRTVTDVSENEISNSLLRMMLDQDKRVFWLEYGRGASALSATNPEGLKTFADSLKEDGIDIAPLNFIQNPELGEQNPDLLIIPSPEKPLLETEIELIDKYILSGNNALLLVEPGQSNGLEKILLDYGITMEDGLVLDNTGGIFLGSRLFVLAQDITEHPALERLTQPVLFPRAGAINYSSLSDADGWERKFLLRPSRNTWVEPFDNAQAGEERVPGSEHALALVMTRKLDATAEAQALGEGVTLDTGADDGPEQATGDGSADSGEESIESLFGAERDEQRLIIVADYSFLRNQYVGHYDNLSFARDSVNWLASNDQLLDITREKAGDQVLNLDAGELRMVWILWGIALPALLLMIAAGVTIYRRRLR